MRMGSMIFLRIILVAGAVAFASLLVWAQLHDPQSLPDAFMAMFNAPWTTTAIVDLYIGFSISALVICLFEHRWTTRLLWALPVFALGNVVTLLWLAWRLPDLIARLRQ